MTPEKERIWNLRVNTPEEEAAIAALAAETGYLPVTARLLYNRGYRTAQAIGKFFRCEDTFLHSPFLMKDVEPAVARLRAAIDAHEKIVIYGDYDVDGVTAVSLLYLYLRDKGADVGYYIPSRSGEGYGLSAAAIDRLATLGVTLIVTVDTGVTAVEEAAHAREKGVDMIITDHHECRPVLPDAVAVINPHRPDCPYPFKDLAGVGVVFKLVSACEIAAGEARGETAIEGVRRVAAAYIDLVAIGTVADVMPLTDENRLIVMQGLSVIAKSPRPGLAALIEEAARPAADARAAVSSAPPNAARSTPPTSAIPSRPASTRRDV